MGNISAPVNGVGFTLPVLKQGQKALWQKPYLPPLLPSSDVYFGQQKNANTDKPNYSLYAKLGIGLLFLLTALNLGRNYFSTQTDGVSTGPGEHKAVLVNSSRFPTNIAEHLSLPFETVEEQGSVYQISQKTGIPVETLEQFNGVTSRSIKPDTRIYLPYIEFRVGSYSDGQGRVTGVGHLNGISKMLNVSPQAIAISNKLQGDELSKGQVLRISFETVPVDDPAADKELTALLYQIFPDFEKRNLAFTAGGDVSEAISVSGSADEIPVDMSGLDQVLDQEERLFELDPRLVDEAKKKRPRE